MFYFLKVINYLVSCRKQFFFFFETAKQLLQNVSFHKEIRHAKSQSQIGKKSTLKVRRSIRDVFLCDVILSILKLHKCDFVSGTLILTTDHKPFNILSFGLAQCHVKVRVSS